MPWSRLRTLTCSPGERNMVEPAAGPCQRCQVSGRTVHIWSGLELAALDQVEGDMGGHHLRHRGGRHAPVGILGVEHRARGEIDHDRRPSPAVSKGGAAAAAGMASEGERKASEIADGLRVMSLKRSPLQRSARDRIGEQADGQRVEVRAIIVEDHAVIVGEQISGAARPVGLEQGRHARRRAAPFGDAEPAPFADGQPAAVAGEDARRSAARAGGWRRRRGRSPAGTRTADAPGQARPPAGIAEIIGDRGERVEMAAPDVGAAVAVAVDREADDRRSAGIADGRRRPPSCPSARRAGSRARPCAGWR